MDSKLEKVTPQIRVHRVAQNVEDHVFPGFLRITFENRLGQQLVALNVLTSFPEGNGFEHVLQTGMRFEEMQRAERETENRQMVELPRQEFVAGCLPD